MTGDDGHHDTDRDIRMLMALAARRPEPPPAFEAEARAAFLEVFDSLPTRASSRWRRAGAMAAAVAVVLLGALLLRWPTTHDVPTAEVVFAAGAYEVVPAEGDRPTPAAAVRAPAGGGIRVPYGSSLDTGQDGRVLLEIEPRLSIRLNVDTRVRLVSPTEVELLKGQVYVDNRRPAPLRVRTPAATVTDIGTRFEVTARDDDLTVALRAGSVAISAGDTRIESRADGARGELLTFSDGTLTGRREVAATDPRWQWIAAAQPGFLLEGASVHDYLAWAARESGYTLRYQSPAVRLQAEMPHVLSGGTRAEANLDNVRLLLRATRFELVEPTRDELVVRFRQS